MSVIRHAIMILLTYVVSVSAYAGWDQKCVQDCLSTHHECHYCDYQCWQDDVDKPEYETGDNYRCPLQGFD